MVTKKIGEGEKGGLATDLVALAVHVHQHIIAHAAATGYWKRDRASYPRQPRMLHPVSRWFKRTRRGLGARGVPTVSGVFSRRASGSDPNLLVTPLWRENLPGSRAGTVFRLQLDPDDLTKRFGHLGKMPPKKPL